MLGPEGLEPPTYCLEGSCSIQMSYDPKDKLNNIKKENKSQRYLEKKKIKCL